jgi:hypothetical protein
VRDYLTKIDSDTNELDSAGAQSNQPVKRIAQHGQKLETVFLDKIKNNGKGIILVEAWSQVTHPLKLQVTKRDTSELVTQIELPLKIDGVEKMFRHKNLLGADNASGGLPDYATGTDIQHPEPENYPDKLCNEKFFVFVHGYNVNPEQARGWNAQVFKAI